MANIVVLIGSKRKNGNTDQLAQSFVKGASKHNNVSVFSVANAQPFPAQKDSLAFSCWLRARRYVRTDLGSI